MKALLFLSIHILFSYASHGQTICIQRGNTTFLETRLDSAILHAQSGDIIYLPSGPILPPSVTINKKLTIIGCGYHPDSSLASGGPTVIFSGVNFIEGSDSSLITGIASNSININASNITVTRCKIGEIVYYKNNNNISENIIQTIGGYDALSIGNNFTKNIIISYFMGQVGNNYFNNNIFFNSISPLYTIRNSVFLNNIFMSLPSLFSNYNPYPTGNTFLNNIFACDASEVINSYYGNSGSNNFFNINRTNIFINAFAGNLWTNTQDYHLQPGCVGIGNGTDGTDIGIYGTAHPFKEGGIPFNPHYQLINIPASVTSPNGTLNVEAQDH